MNKHVCIVLWCFRFCAVDYYAYVKGTSKWLGIPGAQDYAHECINVNENEQRVILVRLWEKFVFVDRLEINRKTYSRGLIDSLEPQAAHLLEGGEHVLHSRVVIYSRKYYISKTRRLKYRKVKWTQM